jgi:DNA polymerase-3 subunit gamma/tau
MTYLVLARKWRPRSFDTLVGQDHVVRALTHALSTQRLHHAWLFTGTRGVGKTTLSRILAKSLNCETGITATPCGTCRACTEIDAGRFVDYVELDAASNRGVDEMTQLLEQAVYAPGSGRFKVYMIDEVHMLTGHAFNAMLKTLEEPPPHVKFILATTDPQKIPVTVLSRCLQFNLKQMAAESIVGHLQHILQHEGMPFQVPALRLLAQAAAGSMRDALSLADQAIAYSAGNLSTEAVQGMLGTIDHGHLVQLLRALSTNNASQVLDIANQLASLGFSYSGALADLAVLLSRIAIEQRVPGSQPADDPLTDDIRSLASAMHPDQLQLFYSVAVHSRQELSLAPDEYAGFVMACLRMLSLAGTDPHPPQGPSGGQQQAAVPTSTVAPAPAASIAAPAPTPSTTSAAVGATATAHEHAVAGHENLQAHAPGGSVPDAVQSPESTQSPAQQGADPDYGYDEPPPWEDIPEAIENSHTSPTNTGPHDPSAGPAEPSDAGSSPQVHASVQGVPGIQPDQAGMPQPVSPDDQLGYDGSFSDTDPEQWANGADSLAELPVDPSDFDGFEPVDDDYGLSATVAGLAETGREAKPAASRAARSPGRLKAADWPALAASLPLTGLASELARQSEWLGPEGDHLVLKVAIRSLAESAAQVRLQTVLSEHFGSVVKLRIEVGATGDDTAHAVDQARKAALQQQAEQAAQGDPFVQDLLEHFDARIVPGSIRPTPNLKAA